MLYMFLFALNFVPLHNKILYIMAYKESTLILNIKEHLKASGKTAKELAEAVGISRVTASNIINNKTAPSLETLQRIAEALGVPLWQLFASPEEVAASTPQESGQGVRLVCPHCGKPLRIEFSKVVE